MARRVGLEQIGAEAIIIGSTEFFKTLDKFHHELNRANKSADSFSKGASSAFASIGRAAAIGAAAVVAAIGTIVAVLAGIGAASLKVAADFQQGLGIVQALSGATNEELSRLTSTIDRIGSTTVVASQEAVGAAGELIRAGVDLTDVLDGALDAVVNLTIASAGELELTRSAILLGSTLSAFNLTGAESERVVNAITVAAQNSAISFVDMFRSFQQLGPVAAAVGFTVEDTAAMIGVLGQQGIRGSDAGTSLKQALIQLSKPTKNAAELMREYGISLFDTNGASRNARDLIGDLEKQFGDLAVAEGRITEAERARAVATIFGSDAIRAALVLALRGTEAFDSFTDSMADQSKGAAELARIMQQPLNARIQILANSVGVLQRKIGDGLIPVMSELVNTGIKLSREFLPVAEQIGKALAALFSGNFGDVSEQLGGLLPVLTAMNASIQILAPAVGELFASFGNLAGASVNAEESFSGLASGIINVSAALATIITTVATFINSIAQNEEALRNLQTVMAALAAGAIVTGIVAIGAAFITIGAALGGILIPALAFGAAAAGIVAVLTQWDNILASIGARAPTIQISIDTEEFEADITSIEQDIVELEEERIVIEPEIDVLAFDAQSARLIQSMFDLVNDVNEDFIVEPHINEGPFNGELSGLVILARDSAVQATGELHDITASVTLDDAVQAMGSLVQDAHATATLVDDLLVGHATIDAEQFAAGLNELIDFSEAFGDAAATATLIEPQVDNSDAFSGLEDLANGYRITVRNIENMYVVFAQNTNAIVNAAVNSWIQSAAQFAHAMAEILNNIVNNFKNAFGVLGQIVADFASRAAGVASQIGSTLQASTANLGLPEQIALPGVDGLDNLVSGLRTTAANFNSFRSNVAGAAAALNMNFTPSAVAAGRAASAAGERAERSAPGFDHLGDAGDKAGKGAKKAKEAAEEALPAIEGFLDALTKAERLQSFIDAFGETGAKAVDALINAVVSNIDKDGAKAGEALHEFLVELRKSGAEDAEELAFAIRTQFTQTLLDGTDEAIEASKQLVEAAAEAMAAQGRLTEKSFRQAFNLANIASQLGSDGAKLMESLREGLAKGGADVIKEIASSANAIVNRLLDKLPVQTAFDFGSQIGQAIGRAIRERTPESVSALQDLVRSLNAQAKRLEIAQAFEKSIEEASKTLSENLHNLTEQTRRDINKVIAEFNLSRALRAEEELIRTSMENSLDIMREVHDNMRRERARAREDADRDRDRSREDADRALTREQELADVRRKMRERMDKEASSRARPEGWTQVGITRVRSEGVDDEMKRLQEKWAREDARLKEQRTRQDADRALARQRDQEDQLFELTLATDLQNRRTQLEKALIDFRDREERRQHEERKTELIDRFNEGQAREVTRFNEIKLKAQETHDDAIEKLEAQEQIASLVFDGMLADAIAVTEEIGEMISKIKQIKGFNITATVEEEDVPSFQFGGRVPGTPGQSQLVRAHAGEWIVPAHMAPSNNTTNNYNYNVAASYSQMQSEASVMMDMQALIALAGR